MNVIFVTVHAMTVISAVAKFPDIMTTKSPKIVIFIFPNQSIYVTFFLNRNIDGFFLK